MLSTYSALFLHSSSKVLCILETGPRAEWECGGRLGWVEGRGGGKFCRVVVVVILVYSLQGGFGL